MSARNRMESLDAGAPVNLSPYPPVSAMNALHARERRMREERLERRMQARAEARMTVLVALFVIVAGTVCGVVDWALAVAVVHP